MDIFKDSNFDFLKTRKLYYMIAGALIVIGLIAIILNGGLKYHIDFTGGLALEIRPMETLTVHQVREALESNGLSAEIQDVTHTGGFLIKAKSEGNTGDQILATLETAYPQAFASREVYLISQDDVGPRAGADLRSQAIKAVFISLFFMLIYIWIRFRFTWGFACVLALVHDTMVTLGILSLFQKEIGMTILAGLLTIIGYSINNTIVIFDRIREDLKLYRKDGEYAIINRAVNETLNRNVLMSLTTILAVVSLMVFGGSVIYDFAFTMFIGVIAGTFSSICIVPGLIYDIVLAVGKKKTPVKK